MAHGGSVQQYFDALLPSFGAPSSSFSLFIIAWIFVLFRGFMKIYLYTQFYHVGVGKEAQDAAKWKEELYDIHFKQYMKYCFVITILHMR